MRHSNRRHSELLFQEAPRILQECMFDVAISTLLALWATATTSMASTVMILIRSTIVRSRAVIVV